MICFTKAKGTPKAPKKPKGNKAAALNRLRSFLTAAEPEAVEILYSCLQGQSNAITYKELREAYLAGSVTEARLAQWRQDYSKLVTSALAQKWREAAVAGARQVKDKYPGFVYEPSMSAGMDFIRRHGAELVTNIVTEQREAINAIIAHVSGYTAVTPDEAARIIRPCVGLTKPQALANVRHREAVKAAYMKAHPHGKEATAEKKAADAAARYAARQHRYRAQNIARTELAFAYNAGHYGATKDAQAQGYIGDCVKVWLTAFDERVCPVCSAMDDEKRNMDEAFSNGKLLPPGHPSCRCAVAYEEIPETNLTPTLTEPPEEDIIGTNGGLGQAQPLTIEQVKEAMTAQVERLPEEQKQALRDYTGNAAMRINGAIGQGQISPSIQKEIDLLDAALKDGVMPETVVLHRDTVLSFIGLDVPSNPTAEELSMMIGRNVTNNIFTSTSFENLGLPGRDTQLWLTVPAGYQGCQFLQPIARPKFKEQIEVLFVRGLRYRITDAKIENGKYVLIAEVLK